MRFCVSPSQEIANIPSQGSVCGRIDQSGVIFSAARLRFRPLGRRSIRHSYESLMPLVASARTYNSILFPCFRSFTHASYAAGISRLTYEYLLLMIVYSAPNGQFRSDLRTNDIGNIILRRFRERTGRKHLSKQEIASWINSQYMDRVLEDREIP